VTMQFQLVFIEASLRPQAACKSLLNACLTVFADQSPISGR
jgi:hypothetical protein